MKILLLGSNGKLGSSLFRILSKKHKVIGFDKSQFNLSNSYAKYQTLKQYKPEIIINTAAYTNVVGAEENKKYALEVNSDSLRNLSEFASELNCTLIHFSTDYVFDGKKKSPYLERDIATPLSYYGFSKLCGEKNIKKSNCKFLIFRISTLLGGYKNNIVYKILESAEQKKSLKMVEDQLFTPTTTEFIAENIDRILDIEIYNNFPLNEIYHLSPLGGISPYKLSIKLFKNFNKVIKCEYFDQNLISPILLSEYKSIVKRPKNCILDSSKLYNSLNLKHEIWEKMFDNFSNKIILEFIREKGIKITKNKK